MSFANPDATTVQPVDPAAATPAARPKAGTILLLGSLTAIGALSIDLYLPSLPAIGRGFDVDAASVQRSMSAFFVGMAIGGLVYGPVSDRIGRRPALLIGLSIYFAASVGCAFAPTIGWLVAGRFAEALGGSAGQVVARAIVRDRYHHQDTARILSLLTLVLGVAPMLAPTIGAWLVTFATWRIIFALLAVAAMIIGIAVFTRLTESRSTLTAAQAGGESFIAAFAALLRRRRLVGYLLAGALNGATLYTYIAVAPDLLITRYGFSPNAFAVAFAVFAIGVIGSSQVNRGLLARYDSDRILGVASLASTASGVALVAAAFVGPPWLVLATMFPALTLFGFIAANATAGALAVDPLRAGSISALIGSAGYAVGAVAASVAGALHDGTARPMAIVMAAGLTGTALALHLLALPRRFAARVTVALTTRHALLVFAVVAVWGTNFVVIRLGLDHLPPLLFATLRFALAAVPGVFVLRRPAVPLAELALYGVLIGVGQFGLLFIAIAGLIAPGLASLIAQSQVFFTIGLALALTGERLRLVQFAALVLGAGGIGVIAAHTGGTTTLAGIGLVLAAAFSWACGNMVQRRSVGVDMLAYVVWASMFAVPPLFALSLLREGWPAIVAGLNGAGWATWAAVAWQAVGNTMFGFGAWGFLLTRYPAATVAPWSLLVPVFGMGAAAVVLGEALPVWKLAAAALILGGLGLNLLWPRLSRLWLTQEA